MPAILYHLRSKVLRSAAKREAQAGMAQLLSKPEIDQLDVAVGIQKDIFRLQIAVGNPVDVVEVLKRQSYFGCVEPGGGLVEPSRSS